MSKGRRQISQLAGTRARTAHPGGRAGWAQGRKLRVAGAREAREETQRGAPARHGGRGATYSGSRRGRRNSTALPAGSAGATAGDSAIAAAQFGGQRASARVPRLRCAAAPRATRLDRAPEHASAGADHGWMALTRAATQAGFGGFAQAWPSSEHVLEASRGSARQRVELRPGAHFHHRLAAASARGEGAACSSVRVTAHKHANAKASLACLPPEAARRGGATPSVRRERCRKKCQPGAPRPPACAHCPGRLQRRGGERRQPRGLEARARQLRSLPIHQRPVAPAWRVCGVRVVASRSTQGLPPTGSAGLPADATSTAPRALHTPPALRCPAPARCAPSHATLLHTCMVRTVPHSLLPGMRVLRRCQSRW